MSIAASFAGNVGQDPELRYTQGGTAVLSFSVATRSYDKAEGEKTTWVKCSLFGKRGESVGAHLKKGSSVFVRGALEMREWTNNSGEKKISLECKVDDIEYVGGKGGGEGAPRPVGSGASRGRAAAPPQQATRGGYADDYQAKGEDGGFAERDDQIPF